jgi:transposase
LAVKKFIRVKREEVDREAGRKVATVGLDLGDRFSQFCAIGVDGEIVQEGRLPTTAVGLQGYFGPMGSVTVAIETGTHSPWVSRVLSSLGHKVLVANSRKLRLIYENRRKRDRVDARYLAKLARLDPELLFPVHHRSELAQRDLAVLRSREALVSARTQMVNHVRGSVKSMGSRLPKCSTRSFHKQAGEQMPEALKETLSPILETIAVVTEQIKGFDRRIEVLAREVYPEAQRLMQVKGVGALTALAFILSLGDPGRFGRSRTVGAYLGLVPATDSSGESDPQLRITKQGDVFLRRLLVGSAQYILGVFGEDCDLRRHGLRIAERGGKNARKRAAVAVARKLSVLLHRLWRTGEAYQPLYNTQTRQMRGQEKVA